jgi:membrane associated rhomboid family serine protease
MFILQLIIPGFTDSLVLDKSAIYNFEIWRFLTAIFLHGGLPHLFYNMVALVLFGLILEKMIGSRKFLLVFFASGIIANIIAVNFYDSSLGASGSIMGIIGCLAAIQPFKMVWAYGPVPVIVASIAYVIIDIFGVFYPTGTGNIAHLSGIGVGLIAGLLIRIIYKDKFKRVRKERIRIPENYMRYWEDNYMK